MIWNKIRKNVLFYTIIVLVSFIIMYFIMNLLNIQFRQAVYYFIALLTIIGTIIGIAQILKTKNKKVKILFSIISICIIIFIIIFWKLFFLAIVFSYNPEHIVTKDGKKYVAKVTSFLKVNVYYYDYVNAFLMGNQVKIHEFYGNGGYDPFDGKHDEYKPEQYEYYDNNGKVIKSNVNHYGYDRTEDYNSNNNDINNTVENSENFSISNDIIYEKSFNDKTAIRVIFKDYVLAQRELIGIEKTTDGGITWTNQIESSDGVIQIHNGSKILFLNENNGFINDPGLSGTLGENSELLVTTNGGRTFTNANIIHHNSIKEENLFVSELPYIEDGVLKLKIYTINNFNNEKIYYEFYSEDNGLNWKLYT